mmetsp:Transcript_75316/g.214216  ORF Transcript_75316/g.214216 Transcript_75316/m.214216 type:complete len:318 (+) Transcript_75316:329-1282(+)
MSRSSLFSTASSRSRATYGVKRPSSPPDTVASALPGAARPLPLPTARLGASDPFTVFPRCVLASALSPLSIFLISFSLSSSSRFLTARWFLSRPSSCAHRFTSSVFSARNLLFSLRCATRRASSFWLVSARSRSVSLKAFLSCSFSDSARRIWLRIACTCVSHSPLSFSALLGSLARATTASRRANGTAPNSASETPREVPASRSSFCSGVSASASASSAAAAAATASIRSCSSVGSAPLMAASSPPRRSSSTLGEGSPPADVLPPLWSTFGVSHSHRDCDWATARGFVGGLRHVGASLVIVIRRRGRTMVQEGVPP